LIGVTDHGLPKGVNGEWLKGYGGQCQSDLDCLRNAYARDVRQLLREKLAPEVSLSFEWHQVALNEILEVRVGPSEHLVSLIESGEIFKRVGATNRKLRPIDATTERTAPAPSNFDET
jgi:predicted HTH transcriptional regulator